MEIQITEGSRRPLLTGGGIARSLQRTKEEYEKFCISFGIAGELAGMMLGGFHVVSRLCPFITLTPLQTKRI